ncbi:hypothetical protein [Flagellimonas onchidii]|uniref:hypothetical protein n=1 Tax=Flagellimonas onchidii TaxID=2562684 RepID=UPI0010A67834|nr:hypothetical protein [Allomuricauda onchidii]
MKIRFKKKRLYSNLILGIIWTGLGLYNLLEEDNLRTFDYGYLAIGVLYLAHYIYDLTNQYLTIENGMIWKHAFGKKIRLDEISWIKKFAGDYILKTESKELHIDTNLIKESSLTKLNKTLEELNLSSDKTPFANNRGEMIY